MGASKPGGRILARQPIPPLKTSGELLRWENSLSN